MQLTIYILIGLTSLMSGYFLAKKVLIKKNNRIIQKGKINNISIKQVGKIWSPEISIGYYFIFQNKIYTGEDFLRIDQLVPDSQLLLFDRHGYPVLRTEMGEFIGEEHIETFIMENNSGILIEFNSYNLPVSKVFHPKKDNPKTLFQNIDIKFPWM